MPTTNLVIRHAALRRVQALLNRQYLRISRSVDPAQNWDWIEVDIRKEMAEILSSLSTDVDFSMSRAVDTYKQRIG